jgi:hypothetical protein
MAHQCWNDGTDRSTLPIHGKSFIGKFSEAAEPELDQSGIFFVRAEYGCQASGPSACSAVTAVTTCILPFEAVTLAVEVSMM